MRLLPSLVRSLALPAALLSLACTQRAIERPDVVVDAAPPPAPSDTNDPEHAAAGNAAVEEPAPPGEQAPAGVASFEACLDRELAQAGLNRYGDADGTMYMGGTPLFDERTGETTARRTYVAQRRPDLVARCETR